MLTEAPFDQKQIAQLFDLQPDAVVWYVPVLEEGSNKVVDFEFRYCNGAASRILKVPVGQILGSRLSTASFIDDTTRNHIFQQCNLVWVNESPTEFTYYSPIFDRYFNVQRSKAINGVLSITRDRTNQVLAEKERERQRVLLDTIANSSPTLIFLGEAMRNPEGKIDDFRLLLVNNKIASRVGKTREEIEQMTYCELQPEVRNSKVMDILSRVIETGREFKDELYLENFGGWFLLTANKVEDNKVIAVYLDINEAKTDKIALEQQADELRSILNGSLNGVFAAEAIRDHNGIIQDFKIVKTNASFTRILRLEDAEVIGKTYTEIFTAAKDFGLIELYKAVLESGRPIQSELYYKDERIEGWYLVSINKWGDDGFVQTFYDYTSLKNLQQQLELTIQGLKRSNERLTEFSHVASHDLNEPLRKVITFSKLLNDRFGKTLEPGAKDYLDRIEKTALRMQVLLENLLIYSRVTKQIHSFEQVNLGSIIQEVVTDLETFLLQKKAKVSVGTLPAITGERTQLRQLFQNLITNAVKFQRQDNTPEITISHVKSAPPPNSGMDVKNFHIIEVTDNGIGFDPAEAEKIFQLFHRLHARHEYEGTGIGLAIVQRTMENHHGYVQAQGEPGKGATFRLYFPR